MKPPQNTREKKFDKVSVKEVVLLATENTVLDTLFHDSSTSIVCKVLASPTVGNGSRLASGIKNDKPEPIIKKHRLV
jgi:hypothetical protein